MELTKAKSYISGRDTIKGQDIVRVLNDLIEELATERRQLANAVGQAISDYDRKFSASADSTEGESATSLRQSQIRTQTIQTILGDKAR